MSAMYFSVPVTLSFASNRGFDWPTTANSRSFRFASFPLSAMVHLNSPACDAESMALMIFW